MLASKPSPQYFVSFPLAQVIFRPVTDQHDVCTDSARGDDAMAVWAIKPSPSDAHSTYGIRFPFTVACTGGFDTLESKIFIEIYVFPRFSEGKIEFGESFEGHADIAIQRSLCGFIF